MTYKPILIVTYNPDYILPESGNSYVKETNDLFVKKFPDYNVFCYPELMDKGIKIELLNSKNLTKAKYKRLVSLIAKNIESLNNKQ